MQKIILNRNRYKEMDMLILSEKIIGDDGISGKYRRKDIYKDSSILQVVNYIAKNYDSYCMTILNNRSKYRTIYRNKEN